MPESNPFGDGPPPNKKRGEKRGPIYWLRPEGSETPEDLLVGNIDIYGAPHHVFFIRVKSVLAVDEYDADQIQRACDPLASSMLDDLYRLASPDAPLQTVEVPGYDGHYVVTIFPHAE